MGRQKIKVYDKNGKEIKDEWFRKRFLPPIESQKQNHQGKLNDEPPLEDVKRLGRAAKGKMGAALPFYPPDLRLINLYIFSMVIFTVSPFLRSSEGLSLAISNLSELPTLRLINSSSVFLTSADILA
jgi:hypothetical protein